MFIKFWVYQFTTLIHRPQYPGAMTEVKLVYEGADAAEEVFKKDAKRLGSKAKGKVGQVGQKAKQATRKGKQIVTKKGRK